MRLIGRMLVLAAIAAMAACAAPRPRPVDLLIRGGTIYTGSDPPFVGTIAVQGDRIRSVGRHRASAVAARRTIDATGLIVAPGFIDPHTHLADDLKSDNALTRLVPGFLMQGVTTAFIGNDGSGDPDLVKVLGSAASKPVGINYAAYAGFGAIRRIVIGEANRAPTAAEMARMRHLVGSAMCGGALGLSTGLFYAPESFAQTGEVAELASEAASRGGVYDSHIRDESSYSIGLAAAIDEAITIGRVAGLPVHIAHIKALGTDVQGQAPLIIAKIDAARRAGQRITADQYPWSASGTKLAAALLPAWAQDGGREALLIRLGDRANAERLRAAMTENLRKRGGAGALLILAGQYKGSTLAAVAQSRAEDEIDAAIAVIRIEDPPVASFNQSERDIAAFMRQPWVMTSSDASPGHPRSFGSFARKYAKYVVAERGITLRQFIERSSALPAQTFGLGGRGRLKPGTFADIVVFDPERFAARATYEQPTLLAQGARYVLVNGVLAVDDGELTGRAPGRALAHPPSPGSCQ